MAATKAKDGVSQNLWLAEHPSAGWDSNRTEKPSRGLRTATIGEDEELVENMKSSVEAKVAAAVAAAFIAVTAAAIGQGGIEAQSSALNYGVSENLGGNTQIDAQAYSSLYDRGNAEVSKEKFRDHDVTGASSKVRRAKQKSREHITREEAPQNQHTRPQATRY